MLQLLAVTVGVGGAPPPAKDSPSEEGEARFRAPNEPAIESAHDLCLRMRFDRPLAPMHGRKRQQHLGGPAGPSLGSRPPRMRPWGSKRGVFNIYISNLSCC